MESTCTYVKMWSMIEGLRKEYYDLVLKAAMDDSTLAQYAGTEKLSQLMSDLEFALSEAEKMGNNPDRKEAREAIVEMLEPTTAAFMDANMFEVDEAAEFEDYSSSKEWPLLGTICS